MLDGSTGTSGRIGISSFGRGKFKSIANCNRLTGYARRRDALSNHSRKAVARALTSACPIPV